MRKCKQCTNYYPYEKWNDKHFCSTTCKRDFERTRRKFKEEKLKERKQKAKIKKAYSLPVLWKKADTLWSKIIRLAWKCEYCGTKDNLNAHHIFTRHSKNTRYSLINGICLCSKHHVFSDEFSAHKTPVEFTYWLENYKGKAYIDELRLKTNTTFKITPEWLQNTIEEFKQILDNQ